MIKEIKYFFFTFVIFLFIFLTGNTKNIIEYVEKSNNTKKRFNFWKLLNSNEE
jgi:hypothetical protein